MKKYRKRKAKMLIKKYIINLTKTERNELYALIENEGRVVGG